MTAIYNSCFGASKMKTFWKILKCHVICLTYINKVCLPLVSFIRVGFCIFFFFYYWNVYSYLVYWIFRSKELHIRQSGPFHLEVCKIILWVNSAMQFIFLNAVSYAAMHLYFHYEKLENKSHLMQILLLSLENKQFNGFNKHLKSEILIFKKQSQKF